jgi:hypothetical protein
MDAGLKWSIGSTAFMLNTYERHWRLSGYLDIAPGRDDFFDEKRAE